MLSQLVNQSLLRAAVDACKSVFSSQYYSHNHPTISKLNTYPKTQKKTQKKKLKAYCKSLNEMDFAESHFQVNFFGIALGTFEAVLDGMLLQITVLLLDYF